MTINSAGDIAATAKKVLLIGWDAAEWKIIRPLVQRGLMPNFGRLMELGQCADLHGGHPLLSPTLWTSMVTGEHPTRHGVLGAIDVGAGGAGFEAVGRVACKAPPIWSILDRNGIPCHTINFPATHPAEHLRGVSISNLFAPSGRFPNSVWPPQCREPLARLRVEPREIDAASLLTFVPRAGEIDAKRDPRIGNIAAILAHSATVHAAATWAMEQAAWRFAAVCYAGLHQFSHGFMAYQPPRMAGVSERDFEIYGGVVTAAYRFHDLMLGRLLELAGAETHVLVVSDHGFLSDPLRPNVASSTEQGMLAWHRPKGVAVMAGPGVKANIARGQVSIFDIAPTILGLFGLAPLAGMRGRPLCGVAKRPMQAETFAGRIDAPEVESSEDGEESVEYLRQLGYVEAADLHAELDAKRLAKRRQYYLAIAWLDAGRPERAVPLLEVLVRENPAELEYRAGLAHAYADARRTGDCRRLVDEFLREYPASAMATAAAGMLELGARRAESALIYLRKAQEMGLKSPGLFADIGQAYLRLRMFADARGAFERAIELDDELAAAYCGLGKALLGEGDAQAAADVCRRAVSLRPDESEFHYELGVSLMQLGQLPEARSALQAAVELNPEFAPALHKLGDVCDRLGQFIEAREYDRRAHLASARRRIAAFEESYRARPFPG